MYRLENIYVTLNVCPPRPGKHNAHVGNLLRVAASRFSIAEADREKVE